MSVLETGHFLDNETVLGTGLSWDFRLSWEQDIPGITGLSWEQDIPGIMGLSWEQDFPGIIRLS
jgi:hypothetical protein